MSITTDNFGITLPEGSDTFNPLTFNNNAFTRVDEVMKANQDRGITTATHIYLDGINTINRTIASCNLLVFTAVADYVPASTIAVDGVTCTFRYADGTAPETGAFKTNQAVVCYLNGTILTLVSAGSHAAIIGDLTNLETETKLDIVAAINELVGDVNQLNSNIANKIKIVTLSKTTDENGFFTISSSDIGGTSIENIISVVPTSGMGWNYGITNGRTGIFWLLSVPNNAVQPNTSVTVNVTYFV